MLSWLSWFQSHEKKRIALLEKAPEGPLKDFLSVPFPDEKGLITQTPIISVDFETTGLDAKKDKLLSVGYVKMVGNQINLATCFHQVINTQEKLCPSNVAIHQITDQEQNLGQSLETVVENLLTAMTGHVMLVHFANIEKNFLQQACKQLYGIAPVFPIIDTLMVEKRLRDSLHQEYGAEQLRLPRLREHYQLPGYYAHNALNDALATAELFLAMRHAKGNRPKKQVNQFLL